MLDKTLKELTEINVVPIVLPGNRYAVVKPTNILQMEPTNTLKNSDIAIKSKNSMNTGSIIIQGL